MRPFFIVALLLTWIGIGNAYDFEEKPDVRRLTVTGYGQASAPPDFVSIRIEVSSLDSSMVKAKEEVDRIVMVLLGIYSDLEIPDDDIEAASIRTTLEYEKEHVQGYFQPIEGKFIGYRVTRGVKVELRELEKVGVLLDESLKAGAAKITRFAYEIEPEKENQLRKRADILALRNAKEQAHYMTSEMGVKVGKVYRISRVDFHEFALTKAEGFSAPKAEIELPYKANSITVHSKIAVKFELTD